MTMDKLHFIQSILDGILVEPLMFISMELMSMRMVSIQVDMFLIRVRRLFQLCYLQFFLHIGQLFFDDLLTNQIARLAPYASHNITRLLYHVDGIFNGQGGNSSILSVNFINEGLGFHGGVMASITLGINSSSIPEPVQGGGGPRTSTLSSTGNLSTLINSALILFHFVLLFLY